MIGGIVIIQTAFPGDVILTGGLVRSIRENLPGNELAVVVRPDSESLARMIDHDLEVVVYDKRGADRGARGMRRVAGLLADGPWDAALIPHRSFRSAMLARVARIPVRIGFDVGGLALLYTDSVPYRRGVHEVERNHDLFSRLLVARGLEPDMEILPPLFHIPPDGIVEAGNVLEKLGRRSEPPPFVVLAPGSVWPTKRWPFEYWTVLAEWFSEAGLAIIWLGGEGERDLCEEAAEGAGTGVVAAGELTWPGTAALLSQAHLLVANDSAPVHLAGAVECPIVALFGPTVPGFGFWPLGKGSAAVGVRLGCRPCRLHGGRKCPEGHFRCMKGLSPVHVLKIAVEAIKAAERR